MRKLTLVFDLDGTVVDSAPDLIGATNHIIARHGLAAVAPDLLRSQISFGARAMLETALRFHGSQPTQVELDQLFEEFLVFYAKNIAARSRPYPGVEQMLKDFRSRGTTLAICTNKREDLARDLLRALHLEDAFDVITGRDTFDVFKPDPGHLTQTIELAGGCTGRAIMIGDSQTDLSTAHAAGIPVIGVSFGYSDPPMAQLKPTLMIDSYSQFDAALKRLLGSAYFATHAKAPIS